MDQHEGPNDQKRRLSQNDHRQDEHVGDVEGLPRKEDDVFPRRMPGTFQVIVGGEEEALEVPDEDIVEGEHGVEEQSVPVLEAVVRRPGLVGREAKYAAPGERVVFAVEIDAGVVPAMMENPPHVRTDAANIENIV